jgi:carbon monoxide dehydrogenase subunit G
MRLDHEFTVPVPAAQAWPVLLDIDRIAPCMPGATVTKIDGDDFEGTVKVKVGPITVTYGGTASFLEKDEAQRMAVIEARGKETRGSGTATARVTAQLFDNGAESTRVAVTTDLSITGKPAQFGRGVMSDVGNKLLGRFADCLAGELGSDPALAAPAPAPADAPPASAEAGLPADSQVAAAEPATASTEPVTTPATAPATAPDPGGSESATAPESAAAATSGPAAVLDTPRREAEPIDLMEAAGGALAKRAVPALAAAALLAILFVVLRRRR